MGGLNMGREKWGFLIRGQNLVVKILGEGNVQRLRWVDRQVGNLFKGYLLVDVRILVFGISNDKSLVGFSCIGGKILILRVGYLG